MVWALPWSLKIHLSTTVTPDHFRNVSEWPDEPTRVALAEKLRQLPGCEHYTAVHVYRYFGNMRFKTGSTSINPSPASKRGRPSRYGMYALSAYGLN